jgi:hypothetical protein
MRTLHWSSIKFPTTPRSLDALVKVSEFLFFVVQYKTEAYYSKWVGILCLVPTSIWRCLILHFLFILACHVNKIYDYINCYCLNFTPRACTQWYIREQWGRKTERLDSIFDTVGISDSNFNLSAHKSWSMFTAARKRRVMIAMSALKLTLRTGPNIFISSIFL